MSKLAHMLPVWFFIGVLLAIYGVIIFVVSILHFNHPSAVMLSQYHPDLFGGIILLLIGGLYTFWFWPGRGRKE